MAVPLAEILAEEEALRPEELQRVVDLRRQRGGSLAEWLIRSQLIGEEDLFFLMSRRLGVPAIPEERLLHLTLSPELRRRVPRALAEECVLIPLDLDVAQGVLSVAMFDPSDPQTLDRLRSASRVASIRPYLGRRSTILGAVRTVYTGEDPTDGPPPELLLPRAKRVVEAIRGKVEIDAGLAEEIASLGESESADLYATSVKPMSEVRGPRAERWGDPERTTVAVRRDDTAENFVPPPPPPDADEDERGGRRAAQVDRGGRRRQGRQVTSEEVRTTVSARYDDAPLSPEQTPVAPLAPAVSEELDERYVESEELEWLADDELERTGESVADDELALRSAAGGVMLPPALPPDIDGILGELFASVGVLVSMLEERVDPGGAVSREHARLSRLVARELGYDGITIDRITVAAHLYGLDVSLRRELGGERAHDVAEAFAAKPTKPGGLNPTLRSLGARALGMHEESCQAPLGGDLVRTVSDYLDLRVESDEETSETVLQLLRAGGADPAILEALIRVVEDEETLVETRRSKVTDRHG